MTARLKIVFWLQESGSLAEQKSPRDITQKEQCGMEFDDEAVAAARSVARLEQELAAIDREKNPTEWLAAFAALDVARRRIYEIVLAASDIIHRHLRDRVIEDLARRPEPVKPAEAA